jgi:hypothetical protein
MQSKTKKWLQKALTRDLSKRPALVRAAYALGEVPDILDQVQAALNYAVEQKIPLPLDFRTVVKKQLRCAKKTLRKIRFEPVSNGGCR